MWAVKRSLLSDAQWSLLHPLAHVVCAPPGRNVTHQDQSSTDATHAVAVARQRVSVAELTDVLNVLFLTIY